MQRRQFIKRIAATTLAAGFASQGEKAEALEHFADAQGEIQPDAGERDFFYRPLDGDRIVGDVMPFYDGKKFRLFYLHVGPNHPAKIRSWYQLGTEDFVHFEEYGEAIGPGTINDPDMSVATGSVMQGEGQYHAFYAGSNGHRKYGQVIMHAVSKDLATWTKIPDQTISPLESIYERIHWRDPFVFWNEEKHEYWMLIAAALKSGSPRRSGCLALCVSKDLFTWETREPFWAPNLYNTHECPDLFRMGEWWYLVFSEFSQSNQTHYRMSRSPAGPWHEPAVDTFDARPLYAAKTCSDGKHRFLVGWVSTRTNDSDEGKWEWGGNLVAHELVQQPNGELSVKIIKSVDEAFAKPLQLQYEQMIGKSEFGKDAVTIVAPASFGAATIGAMPGHGKIAATVQFSDLTRSCGLMLKVGDDLDSCYYVRLEPARNRVVFDLWPRDVGIPFVPGLERSIQLAPGKPVEIKVLVDGTNCEIYVGNQVAMSTRMYSPRLGKCGFFASGGTTHFRNIEIYT